MDTREAGKLGGEARAAALTPERRLEIAKLGGMARKHKAARKARAKLADKSRKANR